MKNSESLLIQKIHKVIKHKDPVRYLISHSWKQFVGFLYLHFHFLASLYQPIIHRNGYKLLMTPTLFSILLYRYKELHREDEEVIMSLLKEGDVYVDVGANIGTTTLAGALSVGASGKVIAFEAHPRTVKGLQKSIDLNPKLKERTSVRFVAIGQEVGITHISDLAMDDINFLTDKGIEVPLSTLDVELADVKHIDLIKIDVEGYEKQVFEGAKETLKKTKQIYFESFEPNFTRFNYTLDDILEQLAKANFTVYSLKNSKKTQVTRGYRNTEEYENLLAIKN